MKENSNNKTKYSQENFTAALLPSTRRAQFKDLFKNEWKTLLGIGFWLFIFAIPYILFYCGRFVGTEFYLSALQEEGLDEKTIGFSNIVFQLIFDGANIIPYICFAIGLAGTNRILSNLIYNEGVLFKDDFITGIKKNSKSYIICAVIFAFSKALYRFGTGYLALNTSVMNSILSGVLIIAIYLIIVPILMYSVELNARYNMAFKNLVKASATFSLITIIPTGIFSIFLFFVLYLALIAQLFVIILIIIIITIVILPFYILLWRLYIAYAFDKHININDYPDFYRRGLSK